MPIYEYSCPKCGHEFELMRPFSGSDKPAQCPKCKAQASRLISVFAATNGTFIRIPGGSALRKPAAAKTPTRRATPQGRKKAR